MARRHQEVDPDRTIDRDAVTEGSRVGPSWALFAAPLPAVLLGALLMDRNGVSSALWLQQIGAALLGTLCCVGITVANPAPARPGTRVGAAVVAVGLVAATLTFPGVDGVTRWVPVGPLRLHASAVALPVLLLALLAGNGDETVWNRRLVQGCAVGVAALLVVQPDAAQASAFGGAAAMPLLLRDRRSAATPAIVAALAALAAMAWTRPDPLAPVPHVEQIVSLAAQAGGPWHAAAIVSLGVLPLPFLTAALRGVATGTALAAGMYVGILCVVPAFGAYPVPVMGFGLSSVLGYYLLLAWLAVETRRAARRMAGEALGE